MRTLYMFQLLYRLALFCSAFCVFSLAKENPDGGLRSYIKKELQTAKEHDLPDVPLYSYYRWLLTGDFDEKLRQPLPSLYSFGDSLSVHQYFRVLRNDLEFHEIDGRALKIPPWICLTRICRHLSMDGKSRWINLVNSVVEQYNVAPSSYLEANWRELLVRQLLHEPGWTVTKYSLVRKLSPSSKSQSQLDNIITRESKSNDISFFKDVALGLGNAITNKTKSASSSFLTNEFQWVSSHDVSDIFPAYSIVQTIGEDSTLDPGSILLLTSLGHSETVLGITTEKPDNLSRTTVELLKAPRTLRGLFVLESILGKEFGEPVLPAFK